MAKDNVLLTTFLEQKSEVKRHSQKVNVLVNSESDKVEDEEKKTQVDFAIEDCYFDRRNSWRCVCKCNKVTHTSHTLYIA